MEGYLAEIRMFAGNFPPREWAFCAGQTLDISHNQALFALLGNNYGGDGVHNFKLPDLRKTDAHGNKYYGYENGEPSFIICINGLWPSRD